MSSAMAACPNCGYERDNRFCPQCGQNDRDYIRSLWRLIADVVKETFEVDGRLPRTLKRMFLRPGELAVEFSRNRRASYISPFRSYLFASILFFFSLAVIADPGPRGAAPPESVAQKQDEVPAERLLAKKGQAGEEACEGLDAPRFRRALSPRQRHMMEKILGRQGDGKSVLCGAARLLEGDWENLNGEDTPEANQATKEGGSEADDFGTVRSFFARGAVEALHDWRVALSQLMDNLPLAMFVTLPAYALLLKLFFFSSHRYYTEHLVFAMHLHTFSFLVYTVLLLLPEQEVLPGGEEGFLGQTVGWIYFGLLAWAGAYSYFALRRYYHNGRVATAFKWFLLGGCYMVLLIPGFLLSLATTLVFL